MIAFQNKEGEYYIRIIFSDRWKIKEEKAYQNVPDVYVPNEYKEVIRKFFS